MWPGLLQMDVLSVEGGLASSCLMARGAAGGSGARRPGLAAARSIRTIGATSAAKEGTMPATVTVTREEGDAGMYCTILSVCLVIQQSTFSCYLLPILFVIATGAMHPEGLGFMCNLAGGEKRSGCNAVEEGGFCWDEGLRHESDGAAMFIGIVCGP